jgi:two-component system, cell cycle sensor histidine kinase and response regulator CckA
MNRYRPQILLVSDEPEQTLALWQSLTNAREASMQVDVVSSLAQTAAHLAAAPVQGVVLDLQLPDSQGLPTLQRVRAVAGTTPVIVIAPDVTVALREAALAAGAEEVYDKRDIHSGLVSHSVLYVMERHRERQQRARLQMLLEAAPAAVLIADMTGAVRYANPAAQALFGHPEAAPGGEPIDFFAPLDEPARVLVSHGLHSLHCEVRLAAVEWEGQAARLASIKPLGEDAVIGKPVASGRQASSLPVSANTADAERPQEQVLAALSQQIRWQMHAISGLRGEQEFTGLSPLRSCYRQLMQSPPQDALFAVQA